MPPGLRFFYLRMPVLVARNTHAAPLPPCPGAREPADRLDAAQRAAVDSVLLHVPRAAAAESQALPPLRRVRPRLRPPLVLGNNQKMRNARHFFFSQYFV